ncbi:DUF6489 family protein [Sphingomonas sp. DT-204]|uniref:DUF6489 family protein n=1 Tax=Sphingomonas sp. DT-204 TaxID=3396166 RepID=UPI003F1ADFDF
MKINVEIDCTPEEARRAIGLPDLTPLHDRYVAIMQEAMNGGASPELLESVMKSWAPMGEAGLNLWRTLFESATKPGTRSAE